MRTLALALAVLGSGCYVGPVIPYHNEVSGARGRIPPEAWAFLSDGTTTRQELALNLGEPDLEIDAKELWVYMWSLVRGMIVMAGPGGGAAGAELPLDEFIVVQFDERGVVARHEHCRGRAAFERAVAEWPVAPSRRVR